MPAEPGAETGMVRAFWVRMTYCSSALTSSISSMNLGSRWPMVGRPRASSTRGGTSDGPGPIRVLSGGWKALNVMIKTRFSTML